MTYAMQCPSNTGTTHQHLSQLQLLPRSSRKKRKEKRWEILKEKPTETVKYSIARCIRDTCLQSALASNCDTQLVVMQSTSINSQSLFINTSIRTFQCHSVFTSVGIAEFAGPENDGVEQERTYYIRWSERKLMCTTRNYIFHTQIQIHILRRIQSYTGIVWGTWSNNVIDSTNT